MYMATTHNLTPMDTTLDMDLARGPLKLRQDMVAMAMLQAILTEAPRVFMDTMVAMGMVVMDMVMARGLLNQDMAMLPATTTEAPRVFMDIMVVMDMVMDMARGLLMLDTMVVPALMSTRAVLTTMDPMAMVSTTMAGGQLMLDMVMDMDMAMAMVAAATSM